MPTLLEQVEEKERRCWVAGNLGVIAAGVAASKATTWKPEDLRRVAVGYTEELARWLFPGDVKPPGEPPEEWG